MRALDLRHPHRSALVTLLLIAVLALAPHPGTAEDEKPELPPPASGAWAIDGGVEVVLPGLLTDRQTLADGQLALVVALDKTARQGATPDLGEGKRQYQVLRLDPATATLETLLTLRADSVALGQAPDPTGGRRLLIAADHQLFAFGDGETQPATLLEAPGLDLVAALEGGCLDPSSGERLVPRVARLEVWRPGTDGRYLRQGHSPLPVTVRRRAHGLELRTPRLRTVAGEDGGPRLLLGPVAEGDHRLWLRPIEPGADKAPPRPSTAQEPASADDITDDGNYWVRFPGPEEVQQSWVLDVDGRLLLAVTTKSADKLGVFEKLSLRTFPLRPDLTRGGVGPSLATLTATRNWYTIDVEIVDLDADGRDDLAVVQPAGLGAGKLVLEVYRGKGTGGFFQTPRRTELDINPERCLYGPDLDGDQQPDLLVTSGGQLLLYPGAATDHKKRVLEKNPRTLLPRGAFADTPTTRAATDDERDRLENPRGRPTLLDLGGRPHILLRTTHRDRTVLRLVYP